MKKCCYCKRVKSFAEFEKRKERKNGIGSYCISCKNEKNRVLTESKQRYKQQYLLSHPCVDCGERDPVVLQFDHVIGIKRNAIANLVGNGTSLNSFILEVFKCVSRCANCHQRKTYYESIASGRFTGIKHVS